MPIQHPFIQPFEQPVQSNIINYNVIRHNDEQFDIYYGMRRDGVILDELPIKVSNLTINDRILIHNVVYSNYFKLTNGNEISMNDALCKNIFKAMKFLDVNPYVHKCGIINYNNPYEKLCYGFILYRSCYPIQVNGRKIGCSSNSLGMNIKIYMMSEKDDQVMKNNSSSKESKVWNEIRYYTECYNRFLKPKLSPNFPLMYGYFIGKDCKLDWDKIFQKGHPTYVNDKNKIKLINAVQPSIYQINNKPIVNSKSVSSGNCGKVVVSFSEGYNYNFYSWASNHYEEHGNIKKMVYTGFHEDNVWTSILFQIIVGLYIMQKQRISFNNFDPEKHIYIKVLEINAKPSKFWKYIIDNIEYYIPNYGYLVIFDTNYNIDKDSYEMNVNFDLDEETNSTICFNKFLSIVEPTKYTSGRFVEMEGVIPRETLNMLTKIYEEARSSREINLKYYLEKYIRSLMNNRIGTDLDEKEMSNLDYITGSRNLKVGKIYVEQQNTNKYRFILLKNLSETSATIITNLNIDNDKYTEEVLLSNLYEYNLPISQSYSQINFNELSNQIELYQI
jgi:hypothetical protein